MIKVLPLGAGQDVGRSCILVSALGHTVMFDCGMHMGYHDERRFPDFSLIRQLDAVVISHFHLDHCGALPFLTGVVGWSGPVIMTPPTKTIVPLLLEDYRRIVVERRGEATQPGAFFTARMIEQAMDQVQTVGIGEQVVLCNGDIRLTPFYAGHVLGAAMFLLNIGPYTVLYTGDYNMTPDRHLGAARLPQVMPRIDLLITECTYATTVRESKRARERDFLRAVHQCVQAGGKVLIPTFALGRAQELCLLLDTYWTRMGIDPVAIPVCVSAGLAERATDYYGLHLEWCGESISSRLPHHNPFAFRNVRPFERHMADAVGPMVLFSTPGMLHSGQSLHVFARWAADPRNMLIVPGYCVAGTVGARVLAGQRRLELDLGGPTPTIVEVKLQVKNLSFSAHVDSKGIMQLVRHCNPRNVMLVHGERAKMAILKEAIQQTLKCPVYDPPNGYYVYIAPDYTTCPARCDFVAFAATRAKELQMAADIVASVDAFDDAEKERLLRLSMEAHCSDRFTALASCHAGPDGMVSVEAPSVTWRQVILQVVVPCNRSDAIPILQAQLIRRFHPEVAVAVCDDGKLTARSLSVERQSSSSDGQPLVLVSWSVVDETLGKAALAILDQFG